jgi:hypothetical protein
MRFFPSSKSWVFKRLTLEGLGISVIFTLWPPLESIQATLNNYEAGWGGVPELLDGKPRSTQRDGMSLQAFGNSSFDSLPFADVAEKPQWAAGDLVTIRLGQIKIGVLLDRSLQGKRWSGWLASAETCWASAFDVLLEQDDEPFDSHFAMIQVWNRVELECSESIKWKISSKVPSQRLVVIRMVAQEYAAGLMLSIPPAPGVIALRTVGGVQMVLTGTPLGPQDPRREYQKLYRQFVARLVAMQLTHRASIRQEAIQGHTYLLPPRKLFDFRMRLRPRIMMPQIQQLLRVTLSHVVQGPDENNCYAIKSNNPEIARTIFMQSTLIDQVFDV